MYRLSFNRVVVSICGLLGLVTAIAAQGTDSNWDSNGGADHRAHSKPGDPQELVDWDNDGKENAIFDASESHSHYFNPGPPIENGYIVEYIWRHGVTGKELYRGTKPEFVLTCQVGTCPLELEVIDNTGDSAKASTQVSVRKPTKDEMVAPTIQSVMPMQGPTVGKAKVSIKGSALHNNPIVKFGSVPAKVIEYVSSSLLVVELPPHPKAETVTVTVSNGFGSGIAAMDFKYVTTGDVPIEFEQRDLRGPDGKEFSIKEVTSLALGPDGLYYAGSMDGYLYVLKISNDFVVTAHCKSPSVGNGRSVLGVAFHPNDVEYPPKVYITTSRLFWKSSGSGESWDNGRVEVWQRGANEERCLGHLYTLVSGLPVSNHDHGVNHMDFFPNGDMLVSIGGTTNAGVNNDEDKIGGIPESPLSSALVRVKLSEQDEYNGNVKYSDVSNPGVADVVEGSVEVFAAGFRNCFGFTRHSNGKFYAMDNGANPNFGESSTSCSTSGPTKGVQDRLSIVKQGGYHGHPNRNRARHDKRQCTYMVGEKNNPDHTPELAVFQSSTNGVLEYSANTFGGRLRGNLLLSKMSWSGPSEVHRVVLSSDGNAVESSEKMLDDGGLRIVMTPRGDLLLPKVKQSKIIGMKAMFKPEDSLHLLSVWPRRGPPEGGNKVLISGSGLHAKDLVVRFGKKPCTALLNAASDGTSVWCSIPTGKPGSIVSVTLATGDHSTTPHGPGDYQYML